METTFKEDLEHGKRVEREVCKNLNKKYPTAYVVEGYCKEWDIVVPEIDKTVEVKLDEKSHYTGNFLIEIEFDGKPSALSTTQADIWILVDKLHYFVVDTNTLKWLLKDHWINENGYPLYTPATFVGKGDIKAKKAFLIPKKKFYNQFIKIYNRS